MRRGLSWLLLITLFSANAHSTSYIPPAQTLEAAKLQFAINNDLFIANGVYDDQANSQDFVGDEAFQSFQSEFLVSYGLTNELQMSFGLRGRYNSVTVENGSPDVSINEYGLESWYAHGLYSFWNWEHTYLAVEASYRSSLYTNPEFNGGAPNAFIVLGDAETEMYFGGIINYYEPLYKNSMSFKLGYRNPGDSLAGEMVYELEGALDFNKVALVANINGIMSMNDDPIDVRTPIDNSPSELYNSSNRKWLRMGGGMNLALTSNWRLDLRAHQTLQGQSTDNASIYAMNLVYRQTETKVEQKINAEFKEYSVEGELTKVSPTQLFAIANVGTMEGVHKGMQFDIYQKTDSRTDRLVARGAAYEVKSRMTIIKIIKVFIDDFKLGSGLIVRGGLSEH
ncbi:MAG: hypothetical protein JNM93_06045 [Bacteriovoracaceae bacterium]|nr:hypothetical protein [Bacteriovoracaceae bacterium]